MKRNHFFWLSLIFVAFFALVGCQDLISQTIVKPSEPDVTKPPPYIKTNAQARHPDFIVIKKYQIRGNPNKLVSAVDIKTPYWSDAGFSLTFSGDPWNDINVSETDLTGLTDGSEPMHYAEYKFTSDLTGRLTSRYFRLRVSNVIFKDEILANEDTHYIAETDQYLYHYSYDHSECEKNVGYDNHSVNLHCNENELTKAEEEIGNIIGTFKLFDGTNPPETLGGKIYLTRVMDRETDGSITLHLNDFDIQYSLTFPFSWHIPLTQIYYLGFGFPPPPPDWIPPFHASYKFSPDQPFHPHEFEISVSDLRVKEDILSNSSIDYSNITEDDTNFYYYRIFRCGTDIPYKEREIKEEICSDEAVQKVEKEIKNIINTFELR